MTTDIPSKIASLSSLMWVWRQILSITKCSELSQHYSLKGNHIVSVSVSRWCTSGCGAEEVSRWSQSAQLPFPPVPRWRWQQHGWDWGEPHSLQDRLHGEAGKCSNHHQTVPPQPQAEVCWGSFSTGRGAIHVVWTTWPLGDPTRADCYQLLSIFLVLRYWCHLRHRMASSLRFKWTLLMASFQNKNSIRISKIVCLLFWEQGNLTTKV